MQNNPTQSMQLNQPKPLQIIKTSQSPGDDLTLSQLFSETFHTPATSRSNTEDMVSLQRQLLEEVKLLRHTQEQLLQVEREKLLVEREKLRLAQAKFDLKKKRMLNLE
ncbi:unnamed protein product [Boreogadus saida]